MLILLTFLLAGPVAAASPNEAGLFYERAQLAFQESQDQAALEWLSRATNSEQEAGRGDYASGLEKAAATLFQWGQVRGQEKSRELLAKGLLRKNQHPKFFFEELLRRYPQSALADDAALLFLEDGFCYEWGEDPACPAFEVRQYENFLETYPFSDRRAHVFLEMARRYQALAERYSEEAPWRHQARAELCGAMAQTLWRELIATYPGTDEAQAASKSLDAIPPEQRPAIPIPPGVFGYLREGQD